MAAGRDPSSLILLLGALAPYLFVASSGHRAMRFVAPVLPAAAWLAARGISGIMKGQRAVGVVQGAVFARAALGSLLVIRLFFVDSRRERLEPLIAAIPKTSSHRIEFQNLGWTAVWWRTASDLTDHTNQAR